MTPRCARCYTRQRNRSAGSYRRISAEGTPWRYRRRFGSSWRKAAGFAGSFEEGIALKAQIGAENVFDLSLGNPIIEPPAEFKDELKRLADEPLAGMHRYMPNPGYMDTRQAVADTLAEELGLPFTANEITMTCGAAAAANVVLKTILNPGEEVIILAPYFFEYLYYIDNHDGVAVTVHTNDRFQLDLSAVEQAVTPRTRAIIVNSPNNPSGVVYSAEDIAGLADHAQPQAGRAWQRDIPH